MIMVKKVADKKIVKPKPRRNGSIERKSKKEIEAINKRRTSSFRKTP